MSTAFETSLETKEPPSVNVLLAYDNERTCGAILDMLDRISTRLHDKSLFTVNAFSFSLLEQMDPLLCASASAAPAVVALVAFGQEGAPGAGLLRWLEKWAQHHAGKPAALGLQHIAQHTDESVRRIVRTLRQTAARHGLGFIYEAEDEAQARWQPLPEPCPAAA